MFFSSFLLLLSTLPSLSNAVYTDDEVIQIYKNFDVKEDDTPACLELDYSMFLCPEDDHIPCAGDEEVKKFCYSKLGLSLDEPLPATTYDGTNAINGCITFVGWGENQVGCCHSEKCFYEYEDVHDSDSEENDPKELEDYEYNHETKEVVDQEDYAHDEF